MYDISCSQWHKLALRLNMQKADRQERPFGVIVSKTVRNGIFKWLTLYSLFRRFSPIA